MFQGLENTLISGLTLINGPEHETLAAVTPAGFFTYPVLPDHVTAAAAPAISPSPEKIELFHRLVRLEPNAREVMNAVVRYADVKNSKIQRWQASSRMAALLPTFSFGRDFSRGNSIDIDRRGTNAPDFYITGPDDISKKWDMGVSWDLGDFIWSSNQTSIDSREKLMVELRNDILAESTRIYYERRRTQMESLFSPPENEQDHLENMLRIDELTSLLDGMSGGYFSKRMGIVYSQHPELERLWEFDSGSSLVARDSQT